MSDSASNVKSIFGRALDMQSPAERAEYLREVCQDNVALRVEIEELIGAVARAGNFLAPSLSAEQLLGDQTADGVGAVIGPYKLLEQIGEGGMGLVYMAEQQRPVRRMVALKIIKPGMDSRQVTARFEAERQALAMMDHANIAKVLDAGTTDAGCLYFVMELVKGLPITKYCDEMHLTIKQRLELFVPVCQAIQHAHQKGIIHRDIKPTNVLVALYDGVPVPKVIDFGVAKATEQKLTEKTMFTGYGQLIGTLEYMSPEQAQFNELDIDTRSDIYSLGVLLYELLTSTTPLEQARRETVAFDETLRIIREEEPPKPSTRLTTASTLPAIAANRGVAPAHLRRQITGDLDWIVMKCLEKDRNRRYETASSLASDIQHYLRHEPVQACPPSALYRLKKLLWRKRGSLVVAGGVLAAALVAAASVGWAVRDRAARESGIVRAQADRQERVSRQARESLTAARALIAENKLSPAREQLAQARARLHDSSALRNLIEEVETDQAELARFQQFMDLIDRAQQAETAPSQPGVTMPAAGRSPAQPVARAQIRQRSAAVPLFLEALMTYDVLDHDDWQRMHQGRLLAIQQIEQIRHSTYEVLLWLADDLVRRKKDHESGEPLEKESAARQALVYLTKAETARQPTQALYVLRARCHKALSDDAQEQANMRLASKTAPMIAADFFLHGQAAIDAKKLAPGVEAFEAALRVEPTHYWSLLKLGYCFCEFGQRQDDYVAATRIFTGCILKRPDHAHAYYCRGRACFNLRRYEQSIADYSKALELAPQYVNAWYSRAVAYDRLGQPDKSVVDFGNAIELDPSYAQAWYGRGVAYDLLRQSEKALADFTKTIELDPKLAMAWSSRGVSHTRLGQPEQALADLEKALELDPQNAYAWNSRGVALNKLNQTEQALAAFTKAIELDPQFVRPWSNRAKTFTKLNLHHQAIPDYLRAIELSPNQTDALNNFADFLVTCPDVTLRDSRRALELATKAIQLAPSNGYYWNTLGIAHYRMDDWTAAVAALEKATELREGGDASDQFFLAMSHRKLGHQEQAVAAFEEGLQWLERNNEKLEADQRYAQLLRGFQKEAAEVLGQSLCH